MPTVHSDPVTEQPDTVRNVKPHLKECQLMSRLGHHPNIIKFAGICFLPEFPNLPAMIMEKVPYGNLHNYLKKQGPANSMELSRKRHILLGVANGLHYLSYEHIAVFHNRSHAQGPATCMMSPPKSYIASPPRSLPVIYIIAHKS